MPPQRLCQARAPDGQSREGSGPLLCGARQGHKCQCWTGRLPQVQGSWRT